MGLLNRIRSIFKKKKAEVLVLDNEISKDLFNTSNVKYGDKSAPWTKIKVGDPVVIIKDQDESGKRMFNAGVNTIYTVRTIENGLFYTLGECVAFTLKEIGKPGLLFRADAFEPLNEENMLRILNSSD